MLLQPFSCGNSINFLMMTYIYEKIMRDLCLERLEKRVGMRIDVVIHLAKKRCRSCMECQVGVVVGFYSTGAVWYIFKIRFSASVPILLSCTYLSDDDEKRVPLNVCVELFRSFNDLFSFVLLILRLETMRRFAVFFVLSCLIFTWMRIFYSETA
jgi:hypothetical protein